MARARVPAPSTLVALLAVAMAATAAGAGSALTAAPAPAPAPGSGTICDTAECGRGTCSVVPGIIPVLTDSYKCDCDPGWSQPKLLNLSVVPVAPFLPCTIPDCSFSSDCINTTVSMGGIPITDLCVIVDCGHGGECEPGLSLFSYQCRCQPGFKNLLNDNSMPCISDSCTFGADCAKLGLVNTPPPPAPAPVGK